MLATLMSDPSVPSDPIEWRPQIPRPAAKSRTVVDPIIEPLWEGVHVLVHAQGRDVRLIDDQGYDVGREFADISEALGQDLAADQAVVDGWLTNQATRTGQGLALVPMEPPRGMGLFRAPKPGPPRIVPHDRPAEIAFVAVDLLVLDGQVLFDLPLLERKRLLDSVIVGSELVRTSLYVRPPLERWLPSWNAVGFTGAMLKAANSRYVPGRLADDWSVAQPLARR
jgi:bifunctional non-homologous end joining protein LigD